MVSVLFGTEAYSSNTQSAALELSAVPIWNIPLTGYYLYSYNLVHTKPSAGLWSSPLRFPCV